MSFSVNGKGYVSGGQKGSTYLDDLWEYGPVQDTWTPLSFYPGFMVYNMMRQEILSKTLTQSVKETTFDLSEFPAGMYTYRLLTDEASATGNVVLTR